MMYQGFMLGKRLQWAIFTPSPENDHDHCVMCGAEFSAREADLHEGYADLESPDWRQQSWVCPECFAQYREEYRWNG